MRRVAPVLRSIPNQKRGLYIKQFQAFDLLKQKSVPVNETSSDSDFSVSIAVDRTALSPCIIASPTAEFDPTKSRKFPFPYTQTEFDGSPIIADAASHLGLPASGNEKLAGLVQSFGRSIRRKKPSFWRHGLVSLLVDHWKSTVLSLDSMMRHIAAQVVRRIFTS